MPARPLPAGAIEALRQRLSTLPSRRAERRQMIRETAETYDVSETTVYRALRRRTALQAVHRGDRGIPRVLPQDQLERYCELIAAMKLRTANKQGRHLSTVETIRLLEEYGVETPDGFVRAPKGLLKRSTVNRYLHHWGYDPQTLARQPPAGRFQAQHSNDCWHFDLSPSDLKQVPAPAWVREDRGHPLLMLYSVVDDRSGVAYQEYHCVYGEDVEAALRFLFAAMAAKAAEDVPFQGIPAMLYMDNGPIARSQVFHQVMRYLGGRGPHASAPGPRRPAGDRAGQGEGRTAVSHRERDARNALPLPYPGDGRGSERVALPIFAALQCDATPHGSP
jgi:hypothetical protein